MEDENILQNTDIIEFNVDDFLNVGGWHNFHKDTKESYFRKILSNRWDIIVDWSINLGNHHFAITINMPIDLDYSYDTFELEWYTEIESQIKDTIFNNFSTTTFVFIVSEKNKSGILHFHCLVAIRNFIDYNYTLKNNIIQLFKKEFNLNCYEMADLDIKVDSLIYFKDIKNWAIYMYKDMYSWKLYNTFYVIENYCQEPILNNLGNVTAYYLQINCKFKSIDNNEFSYLEGIKLAYNIRNQRTLINILQYYLILNNFFIYNDSIYQKIKETKVSYKLIGSLKEFLYDNFQENVVKFFILNFYYYFKGFDFNYLLVTFFIKSKQVVESLKDIITNKIKLDFSILEFNDGIYFIKDDKFIHKKFLINKILNQATIKYYNKSYGRVRQDKPFTWIKGLSHALDIKNDNIEENEGFISIYTSIVNAIHKNNLKQSTLFIFGPSNSGKTSLIVNFLVNFFNMSNIGWSVSAKNFKWQEFFNKSIGIIDEARYSSSMASDLLKITGQEIIIVEKKYSKEHVEIKPISLFIVTNQEFKDKDKSVDLAISNRLLKVEFINTITNEDLKNSKKHKRILKDEEANIIVYCNKLYFKSLKKTNKKELKHKKVFLLG